jgi:hypothetical protein
LANDVWWLYRTSIQTVTGKIRSEECSIFLMISSKNRQEGCVWVALALGGGTGGRGHAPR